MSVLENYRALLKKTDDKSREIVARYPDKIRCGKGCHSCCMQGLTVNGLERESIRQFLKAQPELLKTVEANVRANPHNGQRCSFLDAAGSCLIYEVRPVVCRSHGMPLKIMGSGGKQAAGAPAQKSGNEAEMDVCPLNFTDMALKDVGDHYFINLETLNTILVLLNQQFDRPNAEKRHLLHPAGIVERPGELQE